MLYQMRIYTFPELDGVILRNTPHCMKLKRILWVGIPFEDSGLAYDGSKYTIRIT